MTFQDVSKTLYQKHFHKSWLGVALPAIVWVLIQTGNFPFPAFASEVTELKASTERKFGRAKEARTKLTATQKTFTIDLVRLNRLMHQLDTTQAGQKARQKSVDQRLRKIERSLSVNGQKMDTLIFHLMGKKAVP